ncbi:MAG: PSD1 and planctomycete cytochrome C domain-containing protein [Gemmataceae bacterium]
MSLLLLSLLAAPPLEFNRDIRPILSEYCFTCHGPDTAKRKAGLRLDTEAGGKTVLVPGKPAESELFVRLTSHDKVKQMPPATLGKVPSQAQIERIKLWIEQGAKYQPHWSFLAPTRPEVPRVTGNTARGAIDAFLQVRRESVGLQPAPEADRRTLLRRLSFDLTGLPPTPEEMDAFLADKEPKAYQRAVERLLASEHYGERMALYWLDLVRYGDTGGYHSDNHRDIWMYRDWVIRAFNDNKRFDAFTIEQLAGDLLPMPSNEQKIASGYNRLLMTTEEGGAQPKEYTAKYAADRVRNASIVWLGLTMGCAECHTHKYDPVTIKEFYQFAAFWADVQEVAVGRQPQTKIVTAEHALKLAKLDEQLANARQQLQADTPAKQTVRQRWEQQLLAQIEKSPPAWTTFKPIKAVSSGGQTFTVQPDGSLLASGKNPDKDVYRLTLDTQGKTLTGLRLSALTHPSLHAGSLSRANGNFVLTKVALTADGKPVQIASVMADYSQPGFGIETLLKGGAGWAVDGHVHRKDRQAVFRFARPVQPKEVVVRLEFNSGYPQHHIGRQALALTDRPNPDLGDKAGLPDAVVAALTTPVDKRSEAHKAALLNHFRATAAELAPVRAEIARLEAEKKKLEASLPQTLITTSGSPRVMRVLPRGNWLDDSGEIVQPGTPASLPPLHFEGKRATRLDLARWLMAKENPLTARVFVNRLWKLFFGQGLVTTLDDFGAQGSHPSHPELLDWLAVEFRESGWDIKHLVRLMVTSAAYRQSSVCDAGLRARDPYNVYFARQARFRLDAELVRDNALAVSGLLVRKIGGPSVKPYQPDGYWAYLNFPPRSYVADKGEDQYRRGLYTYVQRSFPHPSLIAFDAPSREECTVERPRSNTPQQALVLLNDPTYVEAARVLAARTYRAAKDDQSRLTWLYRQVLNRAPREAESKLLLGLVAQHTAEYAKDEPAAKAILSVGQAPVETDSLAPLAAWTSVTRALLNLHETITRE